MKRVAFVGFLIWLAATVGLRLGGQLIFRPSAGVAGTLVVLLLSAPIMVFVARAVLGGVGNRTLGAIALVAPGMLLDSLTTIAFTSVFPNMRPDVAPTFGGWLLFCNVVVLLTAALWKPDELGAEVGERVIHTASA